MVNNNPRLPLVSQSYADLATPGVVVEVDAAEAESLGAFEEPALSEADAWESNLDESGEGVGNG